MTTLWQDSFTDTNGTNLTARTPEVGTNYTARSGAQVIQDNVNRGTTYVSLVTDYTFPTSSADIYATFRGRYTAASTYTAVGMLLRWQDGNNLWQLRLDRDSGNSRNLHIYEHALGVVTLRATTSVATVTDTWYDFIVSASGTTISIQIVGLGTASYGSAVTGLTTTTHGLRFILENGTAGNNEMDDLLVQDGPPAATPRGGILLMMGVGRTEGRQYTKPTRRVLPPEPADVLRYGRRRAG